MPPELVPPARVVVAVVVLRCRTVPLPPPARGEAVPPALGDRPTEVALAAGPGCKKHILLVNLELIF
jgi:hypothetical protein